MKKFFLLFVIIFEVSIFTFNVYAVNPDEIEQALPVLNKTAGEIGGHIQYCMPLVRGGDIYDDGLTFDEIKSNTKYVQGIIYIDGMPVGDTSVLMNKQGEFEPSGLRLAGRPTIEGTLDNSQGLKYGTRIIEQLEQLNYDDVIYVLDTTGDSYLLIKTGDITQAVSIDVLAKDTRMGQTGNTMNLKEFLSAAVSRNLEIEKLDPNLMGAIPSIVDRFGVTSVRDAKPNIQMILIVALSIVTAVFVGAKLLKIRKINNRNQCI